MFLLHWEKKRGLGACTLCDVGWGKKVGREVPAELGLLGVVS